MMTARALILLLLTTVATVVPVSCARIPEEKAAPTTKTAGPVVAKPTPTPTPTRSPAPTRTATPTPSATVTPTAAPAGAATPGTTAPTPTPGATGTSTPTPTPAGVAPGTAASFDETVAYKEGLRIEIDNVRHGKIGKSDLGGQPGGDFTRFTVTITNAGRESFDVTNVSPTASYGPRGDEAEIVFSGKSAFIGFTGAVSPGSALSADFAFAIPAADLGKVTVQVSLGELGKDDAIFKGSLR